MAVFNLYFFFFVKKLKTLKQGTGATRLVELMSKNFKSLYFLFSLVEQSFVLICGV